jgi:tRNA pseudouridine55 synthase
MNYHKHLMNIWKHIGETPLQAQQRAITLARELYNINDTAVCYTNRLDPMAQGIITILFGTDIHRAPEFNSRDKTYRFQAILGVSTDSYDPLGLIDSIKPVSDDDFRLFIDSMLAHRILDQEFPPCSAYKYKKKPLWKHHKDGTLPKVMPSKSVTIHNIEIIDEITTILMRDYRSECFSDMDQITGGDFNIPTIKEQWNVLSPDIVLNRASFQAHVSSGTYIRSLVHDTAKKLGIPAHAFRITRIQT